MTSLEEINGICATSVFSGLGYSSDQRGIENSILYGVKEVVEKKFNKVINFTERYFYEEFWFYFISAAQVNSRYPFIEFYMKNQLTHTELQSTNTQSVYTMMRNLAFVMPRDRAKVVGIDAMDEPDDEFYSHNNARFEEYSSLIANISQDELNQNTGEAQEKLIESYVYHLSSSVGLQGDMVSEIAFRHVIASKYKVYYVDLQEFILNNLRK